jgi:hypothetical protein
MMTMPMRRKRDLNSFFEIGSVILFSVCMKAEWTGAESHDMEK